MKIKCRNCIGTITVPDDAAEGDIVYCPDCGRDFEIIRKEGSKIRLLRTQPVDFLNNLDLSAHQIGEDWRD